jgi:hypothetical protein
MFVSACDDPIISYSRVKGFCMKGGNMHAEAWFFIEILKSNCWISKVDADSSSSIVCSLSSPEVLPY